MCFSQSFEVPYRSVALVLLSTVLPVSPRRMAHCVCNPELGLDKGAELEEPQRSAPLLPVLPICCFVA